MKIMKGCILLSIAFLIFLWTNAGLAGEIVIGFSGPLSGLGAEFQVHRDESAK